MKTTGNLCVAVTLLLTSLLSGLAQSSITNPVVRFRGMDTNATWSGDPGQLIVGREGPTNVSLAVFFAIGGTATNGVDYKLVSSPVTIPAGALTAPITVAPINLGQTRTATAEFRILPSPVTTIGGVYRIGSPSNAVVVIRPQNLPPHVRIANPTNGAAFPPGANVFMCADAGDPDGWVATVEFFADGQSLGIKTNNPAAASLVNPFCLLWSNVPPGVHVLTARARDNLGALAGSDPVTIQVGPPPPSLPVVNVFTVDPTGAEIPPVPPGMGMPQAIDPAVFEVTRTGDTNVALEVIYNVGGTASNGVDYAALPGTVTIPAGARGVRLVVAPIDDLLVEGKESVVVRLPQTACPAVYPPPPGCYLVGDHPVAEAAILDNDTTPTNYPPMVRITSPPNNAIFRQPVNIPIYTYARDPDDAVAGVEYFANGASLGFGRLLSADSAYPVMSVPPTNTWLLVWSNAPVGTNILVAQATDTRGATRRSEPVRVLVRPPEPPPTNPPPKPVISIVAIDPIAIEGTNCWSWPGPTNSPATWSNWTASAWRPYTNCGPKNATFAVRRLGPTNEAVTVKYNIGGTATNGVDYVPLPGALTIPAGDFRALISVVPIESGPPDINSTVILRLAPSTNYVIGSPASAAALILDGAGTATGSRMLPDKCFHVSAPGPDGAWFRVEYSTDLRRWQPVCTNQVVNGSIDFIDPDARAEQQRFYRAVPEAEGPAN